MGSPDDAPVARQWGRNLARDYPGLHSGALLVGLLLADYADWRTGTGARPSQETLAAESGLTVRQVGRDLARLEAVGAIRCVGRVNRVKVYDLVTGHLRPVTSEGNPTPVSGYVGTKPDMQGTVTRHAGHRNPTPVSDNHQDQSRSPTPGAPIADTGNADHHPAGAGGGDALARINSEVPEPLRLTATRAVTRDVAAALARGWSADELAAAVCADLDGIRSGGGLARRLHSCASMSPPPPRARAERCPHGIPNGRLLAADGTTLCPDCELVMSA